MFTFLRDHCGGNFAAPVAEAAGAAAAGVGAGSAGAGGAGASLFSVRAAAGEAAAFPTGAASVTAPTALESSLSLK